MANEQQNRNQNQGNNQQPRSDEHAQSSASAPARDPNKEQRFRVLKTAQLARGGSHYVLTEGKTISSHGYDIKAQRAQGEQLEEVGA